MHKSKDSPRNYVHIWKYLGKKRIIYIYINSGDTDDQNALLIVSPLCPPQFSCGSNDLKNIWPKFFLFRDGDKELNKYTISSSAWSNALLSWVCFSCKSVMNETTHSSINFSDGTFSFIASALQANALNKPSFRSLFKPALPSTSDTLNWSFSSYIQKQQNFISSD